MPRHYMQDLDRLQENLESMERKLKGIEKSIKDHNGPDYMDGYAVSATPKIKSISELSEYLKRNSDCPIAAINIVPILESIEAQYRNSLEKEYYRGYLCGMKAGLNKENKKA